MTSAEKEKWSLVYHLATRIASLDPWNHYEEDYCFACQIKGTQDLLFFSFIGESLGQCGIAMYANEAAYTRARIMLKQKNKKHEPLFALQDATIALWGDREDVSKENYALLKELGINCRGRGAWLHFEQYEVGYVPRALSTAELDLMTDGMRNLIMMVRAHLEKGMEMRFEEGYIMIRVYNEQDELYYNMSVKRGPLPKRLRVTVTLQDNDMLKRLRAQPNNGATWEVDWSYLPFPCEEKGRLIYPRLILIVDSSTGMILNQTTISPTDDAPQALYSLIFQTIDGFGKPSAIAAHGEETEALLNAYCEKTGILFHRRTALPQINTTRKGMLKHLSQGR